jgi:hypothetical protein
MLSIKKKGKLRYLKGREGLLASALSIAGSYFFSPVRDEIFIEKVW